MGFLHLAGLGKVHFHEYGAGKKPMLAFHGYGMTGKQFHVLERSVLQQYHVYGFDHFFHNESKLDGWTQEQILAGMPRAMVRNYIEEWFKLYGRQRFSVMGYSIGAKLALILVEEYADLIDEIILMAPDGLSVYKGLHFLIHQPVGRWFFKHVTQSKWLATTMLNTLKKIGFIDENLYKIAYSEMDTPKKRLDVYYTLNLIRMLKPDTDKIAGLINYYQIPCKLIFGEHDHLFPKTAALPFIQKLNNAEVHELPLGHWLVIPALDEYLAKFEI
ncbi:alpha/beta hydrolase [Mucilaginibacter sp.]|uniref:alpha/beta fold hydrolase n=1 Tax=Mucilaginibacter sp. TaxID=1882438 RepID=UPI0026109E9A|nr:alpha/beta hydrolase [Mucilaginibacter sp.]MDB4927375.1 alpha/beta fold hydrolase [Mucilaginibacter sp.]